MKTLTKITLSMFVTSTLAMAGNPMSFDTLDINKDGFVSNQEFTTTKNAKMQESLDQGKRLKNAGQSPNFEDFDTNQDGKVTKEELALKQNAQMKQRLSEKKANKGKGAMMNKGQQGQKMGKGQGRNW